MYIIVKTKFWYKH